ncbi:MAG: hypothetical protein RLZ35_526 [Pseudomonadota bacterium]|jgi:HAD superfamily phosphatase (TIGR01668 family)
MISSFLSGVVRCVFTLSLAWRYRRVLSGFLKKEPPRCIPSLTDISPKTLYDRGVRALVLDFDGVLSPYQGDRPLPAVETWLSEAQTWFKGAVFVLSNLPTPARQAMFDSDYPEIRFVVATRKKPYPEGIQAILAQTGLAPHELLLIDDRLLTGIVLAASTGTRGCWITKPYHHFGLHPFKESFVSFLRYLDQCCLKVMLFF